MEYLRLARSGRRLQAHAYTWLLEKYGPAIVGKRTWRTKHHKVKFSKLATVADEAFMWLCIETYSPHGRIAHVAASTSPLMMSPPTRANKDKSSSLRVMTQTSNTRKGRCGWTNEGINLYNFHFKAIQLDRSKYGDDFDTAMMEHFQETIDSKKGRNQMDGTIAAEEVIALNCL